MRNEKGQFIKGNQIGADALGAWRAGGNHARGMLGKKMSKEIKRKRSLAWTAEGNPNYGKPHSLEHRQKLSENHADFSGEKHWNWKGGKTTLDKLERAKFRNRIQPKVFARDNYTCQICDAYGGSIQVDHIKSWAKYPELRLEMNNCRTLCMACHYYVTFRRKMPKGTIWGHNLSRRIV